MRLVPIIETRGGPPEPSMLVFSAIAVAAASLGGQASAQTSLKAQLVGSWTFASGGSTDPSGRPVWGEGAKGLLIFYDPAPSV
jgi:hypothetical protein